MNQYPPGWHKGRDLTNYALEIEAFRFPGAFAFASPRPRIGAAGRLKRAPVFATRAGFFDSSRQRRDDAVVS
jgi:hypothetical protein